MSMMITGVSRATEREMPEAAHGAQGDAAFRAALENAMERVENPVAKAALGAKLSETGAKGVSEAVREAVALAQEARAARRGETKA